MIRAAASLIQFYATHPTIAFRHAGRAIRIVAANGPSDLMKRVKERSAAASDDRARLAMETAFRAKLRASTETATKNGAVLVEALLPFAQDLTVLDVVHGDAERLRLIHCHLLKKFKLLDEDFYKRTYLAGVDSIVPADHYTQHGVSNGLKPNPFFDPMEYLTAYPDVLDLGMDPVLHYALFGWREGRSAGSLFDGEWYLATNSDVSEANISPLIHFLDTGRLERRIPRPNSSAFNIDRKSGTIIIISHDAELGGAQQVVRVFAEWLLARTRFDVKLVTMRGGAFATSFAEIAPTFEVSAHTKEEVAERLKNFAGDDVKAVFINSVASGGFLEYWPEDTPIVAFIHELPKLLHHFQANLELIKQRATTIIGGSDAVCNALRNEFGITPDRVERVYGFIEAMDNERLDISNDKKAAKEALGIDPETLVITGCGVLHWRKSPEKFIEVARKVIADHGAVRCIWIGGGPDQEKCEHLVREYGLESYISFTGYEPNIMRWLAASDVFLLPSEEDPFPLVCLYAAMALNPIICFEEAGGMPEFVAHGCGRAVPFGDVDAMASVVLEYANDPVLRRLHGLAGRERVRSSYTIPATGPQLLHWIRKAADLLPSASIIVPNYNYARFLPERLKSIASQTFQDFEVILLDDCSTDDSISVLKDWAESRPGTQVILNERNSGSPFVQWMKGMRAANSDLIWIAEADDMCEAQFLETLLPYFDDRNVFLGYCKSVPIDVDGNPAGDYEALYLNRIEAGRWSRPYVATDHEEANRGLGIANCIPNASSVVFRRFEPEPDFEGMLTDMRMCGDWLFYLRAMKGGLVAYHNASLNLHRRHAATVTHSMEGSIRYFDEFAIIRRYVAANYRLSAKAKEKIDAFTQEDLDRFKITDSAQRQKLVRLATEDREKASPSVLFVASDFSPGGGQLFVIRLANAWMRHGGRALIVNARHFSDHEKIFAKVDPRVAVLQATDPNTDLASLAERFDLDLVHSALWWADRWVDDQIVGLDGLPWVSTMHGCYETLLDNPDIDLSFKDRIAGMLERVDSYVHTANKNRRVFSVHGRPQHETRIVNGVELEVTTPLTRGELGLRSEAMVMCLATRAIPEKGWFEAVDLVQQLNEAGHEVDLMLIGEGPAADEIAKRAPKHVHLFGQVENLQDYLAAIDVGILPSTFIGESMPLILLEFMAMGKPIVATDIGEIAAMVGSGDKAAGIVIPLTKRGRVDVIGFAEALRSLLNVERRLVFGKSAQRRFEEQYTTHRMIENYDQLYRTVLNKRRSLERKVA